MAPLLPPRTDGSYNRSKLRAESNLSARFAYGRGRGDSIAPPLLTTPLSSTCERISPHPQIADLWHYANAIAEPQPLRTSRWSIQHCLRGRRFYRPGYEGPSPEREPGRERSTPPGATAGFQVSGHGNGWNGHGRSTKIHGTHDGRLTS